MCLTGLASLICHELQQLQKQSEYSLNSLNISKPSDADLKLVNRPAKAKMLEDAEEQLMSLFWAIQLSIVRVRIQQHIPQLV